MVAAPTAKLGTLGFIGLGQMGRPMASNLLKAAASLVVLSRRQESAVALVEAGARWASGVEAFAACDYVLLCLPGSAEISDALFGGAGYRFKPGTTFIDVGTTSYRDTLAIAAQLNERGHHLVDAPVSGMAARAASGTLTTMVGGAIPDFERVAPVLSLIASTVLHMGPVGNGQLTKLVNQLLFDINAAALAEILPMAAKLGLDPAKVGAVVNSGTGRSYASECFVPGILKGQFNAGYPMAAAYKDLVAAAEIAAHARIPLPVLAAATATYQQALLMGHGGDDKGGMIKVFEALLGVSFRERKSNER
ncbi:MAG: NAD(P)-dependent oxidoreductase [Hyphomicrobiales bacterium]|nr:MAG: NAD(P)-dependent oxidoreductase [Hyphomicrobiales bacterium]